MGLFDKLLSQGTKALENAVSDALKNDQSELGQTLRSVKSAVDSVANFGEAERQTSSSPSQNRAVSARKEEDDREFSIKLPEVIQKIGEYEIRRNISPDELEQEAGRQIYTRGGVYCKPENISYGIYKDGQRLLLINSWWGYEVYKHKANRQIREYCDTHNIKVLDFFEYLPNRMNYMEERIREQLL